jgi:FHA domain
MTAAASSPAASKAGGLLGSLRDALAAASRDDTGAPAMMKSASPTSASSAAAIPLAQLPPPLPSDAMAKPQNSGLSAAEAAKEVRATPPERHVEAAEPPTTRVMRGGLAKVQDAPARTQLVRGKTPIKRGAFEQDPVVAWLVIVGGPGIGQFKAVYEGNNTVGRSEANRIALDFGDDAISSDEQAYIRYDSAERSFLFVPNLAKTNIVSVNDKRPSGAVTLAHMDVITMGRTQLVFVPFCGPEFDWSAITEPKA